MKEFLKQFRAWLKEQTDDAVIRRATGEIKAYNGVFWKIKELERDEEGASDMQRCEICGEPATINYQKIWVCWEYDAETDSYSDEGIVGAEVIGPYSSPDDEDNIHLCAKPKCYREWLGIS